MFKDDFLSINKKSSRRLFFYFKYEFFQISLFLKWMLKERSAFWARMNVVEIISNSIKKIPLILYWLQVEKSFSFSFLLLFNNLYAFIQVCYPPCNIRRKSFQNLICVMVAFGTLLFRFPVFFRIVFAIVSISFH